MRVGALESPRAKRYAYPAPKAARDVLRRVGWVEPRTNRVTPWRFSASVATFLDERHPADPAFGNTFDIPLLLYAEKLADEARPKPTDGDFVVLNDYRIVPVPKVSKR